MYIEYCRYVKMTAKTSIREKMKSYILVVISRSTISIKNICCKFSIQKLTSPTALFQSSDEKKTKKEKYQDCATFTSFNYC